MIGILYSEVNFICIVIINLGLSRVPTSINSFFIRTSIKKILSFFYFIYNYLGKPRDMSKDNISDGKGGLC